MEAALLDPLQKPNKRTLVFICNYESVWRPEVLNYLLRKRTELDCVICDESHRIKSPGSKCSRALTRLGSRIAHRYLVTGTPLAENPMDVYAQYKFLDKTLFGTRFQDFKNTYQNVDLERSMKVGYPILDAKEPYKNLDKLKKIMFSCAFKAKSSVKLPSRLNIVTPFQVSERCYQLKQSLFFKLPVKLIASVTDFEWSYNV
jgi:hypothetical protein